MADSKEDTSAAKNQKESLISDDFGSDFLSSWKPLSVSEDDGLEAFNFDKLDMDFSLDGDLGKNISSFKVDMPDLDFSSSAKNSSKPKEKNTEESSNGKQGGKQSNFNFDFDFNELDNFEFGSNLLKGENKSDKAVNLKDFDSPGKPEEVQTAEREPVKSIGLPGDMFDFSSSMQKGENKSCKAANLEEYDSPGIQEKFQTATSKPLSEIDLSEDGDSDKRSTSQDVSTSNSQHLIGDAGKSNAATESPSTSANFGNLIQSPSNEASPEKDNATSAKETGQCSQHSERTLSAETNAQNTTLDSSIRSVSRKGSIQEASHDTQGEVCSSATEEKTNLEELLDTSVQLHNQESLRLTHVPVLTTKSEYHKTLGNQSNVHIIDKRSSDSMRGGTDISGADHVQKILQSARPVNENKAKPKLLPPPLSSSQGGSTRLPEQAVKSSAPQSLNSKRLSSPPMKREMYEEQNAGPTTLCLLKCPTSLLMEYRRTQETCERSDKTKIHNTQTLSHCIQSCTNLEISRDESWKARAPLLMENDGIVEKAEPYAKELDDKILLSRAIRGTTIIAAKNDQGIFMVCDSFKFDFKGNKVTTEESNKIWSVGNYILLAGSGNHEILVNLVEHLQKKVDQAHSEKKVLSGEKCATEAYTFLNHLFKGLSGDDKGVNMSGVLIGTYELKENADEGKQKRKKAFLA